MSTPANSGENQAAIVANLYLNILQQVTACTLTLALNENSNIHISKTLVTENDY
jgi:hypothetical protein